jgi:hypothetical protein
MLYLFNYLFSEARSPVFRAMFTGGMRERSEKTIKIYDIDTVVSFHIFLRALSPRALPFFALSFTLTKQKIFSEFLKFIYCGRFDEKILHERTIEVLATANKVQAKTNIPKQKKKHC